MAHTTTLSSIKDCTAIYSNGEFVFVCGKKTYLFRQNGEFIAVYKNIRYPSKIAFLSATEAIVDSGYSGFYYLIDMSGGKITWEGIQKGRRMVHSSHFAISSDGKSIYDVCALVNGSLHMDVMRPQEEIHHRFQIKAGYRVTKNVFCDEHDTLCLMQTQIRDTEDDESVSVYQCGLLEVPAEDLGKRVQWKHRWEYELRKGHHVHGCDGRYVLYEDYYVEDLVTGNVFYLLENDTYESLQAGSFDCTYNNQSNYLTVSYYAGKRMNVVIDCTARKRIAQYERESMSVGYKGCIVGNEFWMGTEDGIIKYPFPNLSITAK